MRILALAALLSLGGPGLALAQAVGVPPIEQEPRPGAVQQREQSLGLAPSPGQERRQGQEVDQIYRELTGQNPGSTRPAPMPPPLATPQQDAREEDRLYRELMGQNPAAPPRGPMPQQGPPVSSQAGTVNQLYQGMTGQNPTAPR
jgi:hypothetical protein